MFQTANSFYENLLKQIFGESIRLTDSSSTSGGCIHNTVKLTTNRGNYFLKWNENISDDMFEKEGKGLKLLFQADEIKVPEVISFGELEDKKYLLMEYLEPSPQIAGYWEDFGISLANLHRNHLNNKYGLDHDNYIGSLYQKNNFRNSWIDFFREERLEAQLQLALKNGLVSSEFASRYQKFYNLLPNLLPENPPSLLHGDLWNGNFMTGPDGKACLIDPAVYYGNREIELAFTRMFGGFDSQFYSSYHDAYPLEPGFDLRVEIYNMYPSMVHVNLFGTSYLLGVESVLRRYL